MDDVAIAQVIVGLFKLDKDAMLVKWLREHDAQVIFFLDDAAYIMGLRRGLLLSHNPHLIS